MHSVRENWGISREKFRSETILFPRQWLETIQIISSTQDNQFDEVDLLIKILARKII